MALDRRDTNGNLRAVHPQYLMKTSSKQSKCRNLHLKRPQTVSQTRKQFIMTYHHNEQ